MRVQKGLCQGLNTWNILEILCFVQDDVVMGTLTVRENLRFSAALRLPKSIRQREKDEKIEKLIQELGLSKVADSRVTNQTHIKTD